MCSQTKPMEVRHGISTPTTVMVVGPTGCGKTQLVFRMLLSDHVFLPAPTRIMYHYGAWQNRFTEVEASDSRFEFVEGLPTHDDLPSGTAHTVMVIGDLMEEVSKSKTAMDIFIKHSHHRNMTVLFLVQKLYGRTHNTRVISQKAHLMVLFKNPRYASSVQTLGRQMYPGNNKFLSDAYADATKRPHSYLVVNSHQKTDDRMRVIGNLFNEKNPTVYIPKHHTAKH